MSQGLKRSRLEELVRRAIQRLRKRRDPEPEDPYAYSGAPSKPRPPQRGAARAQPLD